MKRSKNIISLITLIFLSYFLYRASFLYPKWENQYTEATLSWDVFGYYLYLPAQFVYDDLKYLRFRGQVMETYRPAGDFHHAVEQPNGEMVMKYPIGMSILYFPAFLLGHFYAHLSSYPVDGFSWPYQFFISMGSIVYAVLGLILLRKILLRYYSDLVVALSLGIIVLATNYFNYVSYDGAMTHNYLFTLYALIIWLTISWHEKPKLKTAAWLGAIIGLATITRPTELLSVLIPVLWNVYDKESLQAKWEILRQHWSHLLVAALLLIGMGFIQMQYWFLFSGKYLYYSYGEYTFNFLRPRIWKGLFSFKKGWLIYTPIMSLALVGLIPFFKQHREKFLAVFIFILINIYVVFSWEMWWYGGSFGSRPVIQSYAVLSLPLAACLTYLLQTRVVKWVALVFILFSIELNLFQTWQAHSPEVGIHPENMTQKYYWKIFGKTNPPKDYKKYLDIKYELNSTEGMTVAPLYVNDFEQDTAAFTTSQYRMSGEKAMLMDASHQYSPAFEHTLGEIPKGSWVRSSAAFMYIWFEWNEWQQCQLVTQFFRDGKPYKGYGVRMQRTADPWNWHTLQYELKVPRRALPGDVMKVYIWNANGQQQVFVDDMKVEWITPVE